MIVSPICARETPDGNDWHVWEFYYNSAWQLLEVRKDTGKSRTGDPLSEPSLAATVHKQFVWSIRYIDAPVLRDRDGDDDGETGDLGYSGSGLEERLYYMTDANMNVTALIQGTPGDGDLGKVVERYVYDPYGKVTALHGDADADDPVTEWDTDSTPDWDNRVLFCGYWRDGDTGLDHVRRRFYHPTLGRWLTRDPIGYIDGMSLYEYAGTSPTVEADPLGLKRVSRHRQHTWQNVYSLLENWIRDLLGAKGIRAAAHYLEVWGNTNAACTKFIAFGKDSAEGQWTFTPPLIGYRLNVTVPPVKGQNNGVECITYTSEWLMFVGIKTPWLDISLNLKSSTISIMICADGTTKLLKDRRN